MISWLADWSRDTACFLLSLLNHAGPPALGEAPMFDSSAAAKLGMTGSCHQCSQNAARRKEKIFKTFGGL